MKILDEEASIREIAKIEALADTAIVSELGLRRLLESVVAGHPFPPVIPFGMTGLFRARPNKPGERFTSKKDLFYPPAPDCRINRFNLPQRPKWYLNGSGSACVAEIGIEEGAVYTIAEVKMRRLMPFLLLGMSKSNSNRVGKVSQELISQQYEQIRLTISGTQYEKTYDYVEKYIANLSTRVCRGRDKEICHRASAMLGEILFERPDVEGLVYPSTATLYCSTNFCVSTDFADKEADLTKVWEITCVRVQQSGNQEAMFWSLNAIAHEFDEQGNMQWNSPFAYDSPNAEMNYLGFGEDEPIAHGPCSGTGGKNQLYKEFGFEIP